MQAGLLRVAKWIGPAILVLGIAGLLFSQLYPRTDRSSFEFGLFYTIARYEQALTLVGAGVLLARAPRASCFAGLAILVIGLLAGGFLSDLVTRFASGRPDLLGYVFLIGPVCCLAMGTALAAPDRIGWLPGYVALVLSGASLGMVMSFAERSAINWFFAAGAMSAGLWLVAAVLLVLRPLGGRWLPIGSRIFGSWLIAVGAMLIAVQAIPRAPPDQGAAAGIPWPIDEVYAGRM